MNTSCVPLVSSGSLTNDARNTRRGETSSETRGEVCALAPALLGGNKALTVGSYTLLHCLTKKVLVFLVVGKQPRY